jgi:hypothetical protein
MRLHNVEKTQDCIHVKIATQIEGFDRSQYNMFPEDDDQPNDAQSQPIHKANSGRKKVVLRWCIGKNGKVQLVMTPKTVEVATLHHHVAEIEET